MERCLKKRAALRSQVTRILNECQDAMQRDLPGSEAAVLHTRLKKVTKNLETLDNKIETLVPDEDFEDECAQVLDYNDRILSCLTRLQQRIDGDSVPSAAPLTVINEVVSTEQTQRSKIKLPKLELIKFSGRSNEWQHFWELFEEVVDKNEDLSSIDKYNFLRASLTGDAATAIAGLPPTARCYNDAVQLLKKRFGNEELLIQEHFKKLIDLKPVRSSEDVRGLRRLHDTLAAHIRGLETLGRKLETFSSMLLPIAQRALPGDLLLDYSRKRVLDTSNDGHYSRQTPHTEGVPETTTDSQKGTVTSFCRLLDFLRVEVESRENLAALRRMDGRRFKLEVLETDVICDHKIPAPPQSVAHQLGHLDCDIADLANGDAPEDIGLLIGSEYIWGLTTGRMRKLGESLRAVETVFGWSVQGPIEGTSQQNQCTETVTLRTSVVEDKTADVLSKFWTLESIGITDKEECKPGECAAMEVFEQTLTKVDGRYEVALPWKTEISLDDNKEIATKRLQQLTNRLLKSPELLEEYDAVIRQYIAQGIVERVEGEVDDGQNVYYMPHQAVIRESRKLRIVFDASSHHKNSKSLNENLETGPNLTADLVGLLLNFRRHRIALVADIERAFLQIGVRKDDRNALRFMWFRETPQPGNTMPPVDTWRMTRVPFGTTASPFLLSATLQHHLSGCEEQFPLTAHQLRRSLYVDDLLTGANDEEAALKLYNDANEMFTDASMKLHKWSSNNERLRSQFEEDSRGSKPLGYLSGVLKVLGLTWDPITDVLAFSPCLDNAISGCSTKRSMLQTTARIFDPLGWLSPFIVRAKILFQQLWRQCIQWDDPLPSAIADAWDVWIQELRHLPEIQVPRFYGADISGQQTSVSLHVFADASPAAYGAVAYITVTNDEGTMSTIVMSKSRVAPVKELTLARLELMACLLAARLCRYILNTLDERPATAYLWTDSTIALHWIFGNADRWQQFVRNRVVEIQTLTGDLSWRHCPGKDNPADLLTRGLPVAHLTTTKLWWAGPSWICLGESEWPHDVLDFVFSDSELEQKKRFIARRGVPSTVYSDNALTFKKTSKDLAMLWRVIRNDDVRSFIANTRVEWKFIVERAPWWGGFYERLVGLTKQALKKTLGTSYLTFEQLTTTLSEVEAMLNSRPLTHVYTEPSEPDALCPAFFLTGKRLTSLPGLQRKEIAEVSCGNLQQMLTSRSKLLSDFWKRWASEYLNELQGSKIHRGTPRDLKSGDLVLLKESLQPRQLWKMGRVEHTFPGRDGKVRSCTVRVSGGSTVRRPIQVLYPLEMRD
ncbi:uncharacterized protein LOC144146623 [Haemaphysalis longicornis]